MADEEEDELEDDELDDDYFLDEEDEEIPVCPECGSDDLTIIGEDDEGNNEYGCEDCGERFSDGEEEDA
jgi:DNA-directed RNA polymerase subunit RPC12/RpoP